MSHSPFYVSEVSIPSYLQFFIGDQQELEHHKAHALCIINK